MTNANTEAEEPIDSYHWHEALDRTHMVSTMLENALSDHPVINNTPELSGLLSKVAEALDALYQKIGEIDSHGQ